MKIPFVTLQNQHKMLQEPFLEKVKKALDDSSFILGKEVEEFEAAYGQFSGTTYCLGVGNGTDALKICLQALDIHVEDEVILPANTFVATAIAVSLTGAKPIIADVDAQSFNLSAKNIQQQLSPSTKAIIPVHLYGNPSPMHEILQLAKENSLHVIEDNAQAQGAQVDGKTTGSFGTINATSFYPSKNIGALGDAGAITTNNVELYNKARLLRNLGSENKYVHEIVGNNSRLDTLQAAFLSLKLPLLHGWNTERRKIAKRYAENLSGCTNIILPQTAGNSVFHLYVIRSNERNELQNFLHSEGVQTLIHYPLPIHLQPAFSYLGYGKGDFPVAETLCDEVLSLPLYIGMTDDEIDYVCEKIMQFYK